jgi:hypothetical protein
MLTDPRLALAEQSNFIGYLMGLAGVSRVVHALASDGDHRVDPPREADDFVYLLLAFAGLGESIERLADSGRPQASASVTSASQPSTVTRWLR